MRRHRDTPIRWALCLATMWAACGGSAPGDGSLDPSESGRLRVQVSPLQHASDEFVPIASATYDLVVSYLEDDGTWKSVVTEDDIGSQTIGGGLVFVSPCQTYPDGSDRPGQVEVTITGLFDADGAPLLDAELPPPQVALFVCKLERDVGVTLRFTVMRSANRGFADVSVELDDVFCSAKFDCVPALLRDESGVPRPTFVTGLSCHGAAPDTWITMDAELVCFDDDGIPEAPETVRQVFNGTEDAGGHAFHNTATMLHPDLMARYASCRFVGRGVPTARDGGPRDARFRQLAPFVSWDVEVRADAETGALVCTGEVGIDYLDALAEDGVTPRDGAVAPSRDAPLTASMFTLDSVTRLAPDCADQEEAARVSKRAMRDAEEAVAASGPEMAALEAALVDLGVAADAAEAAAEAIVAARSAAETDPNADAVYAGLQAAYEALIEIPAGLADTAAAREALWVLVDDADDGTFVVEHFEASADAIDEVRDGLTRSIGETESRLAEQAATKEARQADYTEAFVNHGLFLQNMRGCHDRRRERRGIAWSRLESVFPWPQDGWFESVHGRGWYDIVDEDERQLEIEVVNACAFGHEDEIARIVLQVRQWSILDSVGTRGFIHLIRAQPPFEGFYCVQDGAGGPCRVFPIDDIPCGFDNEVAMSEDGYVIGDGAGSEDP